MSSSDSSPQHPTSTASSLTRPYLPKEALAMGQAIVSAEAVATEADQGGKLPFSPPAGYTCVGTVNGWDTLSVSASPFGYWLQSQLISSEYMLAIRGTDGLLEAGGDLWAVPTAFSAFNASRTSPTPQVHGGFWGIYTGTGTGPGLPASMQGQLFAFLNTNKNVSTLYIGGHSLGGALAELFALDLAISIPKGGPAVVRTITYAAPMVGLKDSWDTAYAQFSTQANTTRVVNELDVVPTQPGNILGLQYTQVGQAFDVRFYNQIDSTALQELGIRHEIGNYLTVVTNAQPRQPQVWTGTFPDASLANTTDTSATSNM